MVCLLRVLEGTECEQKMSHKDEDVGTFRSAILRHMLLVVPFRWIKVVGGLRWFRTWSHMGDSDTRSQPILLLPISQCVDW